MSLLRIWRQAQTVTKLKKMRTVLNNVFLGALIFAFCSLAHAQTGSSSTGFSIVTTKGYVTFYVPSHWRVISMQSKPPISVAAFQIPNPADDGTPHSSNVVMSLYHVDFEKGKKGVEIIGRQYGQQKPKVRTSDGWTIFEQQDENQGALYTILDAKKPFADVIVGIRVAWPKLSTDFRGWDQNMRKVFDSLLRDVSGGFGKPPKHEGEVVRRPM
jgi:hypothetical protein